VKAGAFSECGADEVILRSTDNLADALLKVTADRRFDAVLDSAAGDLFGTRLSVLREDGSLVTCGPHAWEKVELDVVEVFQHGLRIVGFRIAQPDELMLALGLIRDRLGPVPVARVFPVHEAAEAHRFLDQQRHVGKVLLVAE
jgi:NADPH:quinone reductase-like Zn-dependent oxidoreductase